MYKNTAFIFTKGELNSSKDSFLKQKKELTS